jgi:hypothetical protein
MQERVWSLVTTITVTFTRLVGGLSTGDLS